MGRILPTGDEIDDLRWMLCTDYPKAAHQLIKLVDRRWNEKHAVSDDDFLDTVRRAILIRLPNVFAGGSEEERELRRRLIEELPAEKVAELAGEFLRSSSTVYSLHEIRWHSGGKWPIRLMSELGISSIYAGPMNREGRQKWEDIQAKPPYRELKEYQIGLKNRLLQTLTGSGNLTRCMISLPTGAGKTRIAVEALIEWMKTRFSQRQYLVWIAQSEELCEQAIECIKEIWQIQEYSYPLRIYRYFGGNHFSIEDLTGGVVVSTIHQLDRRAIHVDIELREILRSIGAVIIDEAHRSSSHMYRSFFWKAHEEREGVTFPVCGLSATPGQVGTDWEERLGELRGLYFQNLITPELPDEYLNREVDYFRDMQYLARPKFRLIRSGRTYTLTDKELRDKGDQYELPSSFIYRVSKDRARNIDIINELRKLKEIANSAIVYAPSVEQAHQIASELNRDGVVSFAIDSDTPRSVRREVIRMFKERELKFIINYSVLTTGFDAPKTEYIVICRPILSVVLYEQIIGRGLRGPVFGGTEYCHIIDFVDNIDTFGDQLAYTRFKNYWEK